MAAVATQWQARTIEVPPVDEGSPLAGDNQVGVHVSSVAWYALAVATEHLDFCLTAIRETQTLYPTAYLTVLRTGLLSASNAVWILSPSRRRTRQERTLRIQADDLRSQIAMVRSATALTAAQTEIQSADLAHLQQRQEHLQESANHLGITEQVARMKLNNTMVITTVADQLHAGDDPVVASGVQLLWRTGSAVAHAQRSHAIRRLARDHNRRNVDGTTTARLRGDLVHDVGPAAAAVALTLSEGFRLYDERRQNPRR